MRIDWSIRFEPIHAISYSPSRHTTVGRAAMRLSTHDGADPLHGRRSLSPHFQRRDAEPRSCGMRYATPAAIAKVNHRVTPSVNTQVVLRMMTISATMPKPLVRGPVFGELCVVVLEMPVPGMPTVVRVLPSAPFVTLAPLTPTEVEIPRFDAVTLTGPTFLDFRKFTPAISCILSKVGGIDCGYWATG